MVFPSLGRTLADLSDSYTAPEAPSYSPRTYSAPSYQAPVQTVQVKLPNLDYYKHEQHHYYHAGPPRVFHVKVFVCSWKTNNILELVTDIKVMYKVVLVVYQEPAD